MPEENVPTIVRNRAPCSECGSRSKHRPGCSRSPSRPQLETVPVEQIVAELKRRRDSASATLATINAALEDARP